MHSRFSREVGTRPTRGRTQHARSLSTEVDSERQTQPTKCNAHQNEPDATGRGQTASRGRRVRRALGDRTAGSGGWGGTPLGNAMGTVERGQSPPKTLDLLPRCCPQRTAKPLLSNNRYRRKTLMGNANHSKRLIVCQALATGLQPNRLRIQISRHLSTIGDRCLTADRQHHTQTSHRRQRRSALLVTVGTVRIRYGYGFDRGYGDTVRYGVL